MSTLAWILVTNWAAVPLLSLGLFIVNRRPYAWRAPMVVCQASPFVVWCFENKFVSKLTGNFRARAFTWGWVMVTFDAKLLDRTSAVNRDVEFYLKTAIDADRRLVKHEKNHAWWALLLGLFYFGLYLFFMALLVVDGDPKTSPYDDNPLEKMANRAEDDE